MCSDAHWRNLIDRAGVPAWAMPCCALELSGAGEPGSRQKSTHHADSQIRIDAFTELGKANAVAFNLFVGRLLPRCFLFFLFLTTSSATCMACQKVEYYSTCLELSSTCSLHDCRARALNHHPGCGRTSTLVAVSKAVVQSV